MPTIKVNTSLLSNYESDMQGVLSRINSITNQFNNVSRNLDWDIKAESNINSRLSGISQELSAESSGINGMKNYLGTSRAKYAAVENKNSGKKLKNEVSGNGHGFKIGSKSSKNKKTTNITGTAHGGKGVKFDAGKAKVSKTGSKQSFWDKGIGKWIKSTAGKGLVVGTVISAGDAIATFRKGFSGLDISTGIKTATGLYKNISGAVKNTIKIGKAISATSKTIKSQNKFIESFGVSERNIGRAKQVINNAKSDTIKKMLGIDDSLSAAAQSANVFLKNNVVTQSWGARFADQFGESIKASTKGLKKPAGRVSSVLTVVTNGVSNYGEWKSGKISGMRAVAETVTESVIDIGTGLLVGAAVTAGLAATVGSAPVLAVAAVSTGVIMGADALCKCITKKVTGEEKGLTETVSDFVLDTGKKYVETKIEKAKTIFNVGSKVVAAVCGG